MMKLSKTILIAVTAGSMVVAGCGGPSGPQTSGDSLTEGASVSKRTEKLKKIFRAAPSPMETARIVQKTGAQFDEKNLHSAMAAGNYVTSDKQAINLGIYGADLSYATIFEENAISISYLDVVKSLASELGIGDVLGDDMIERAESNRTRQDSLVSIVSEAFFEMNQKLKANGQEDLSGLLVASGWLESMYLATRYTDQANDDLKKRIAEQKMVMEDVMILVKSYEQSPELANLISAMQPVVDAFNEVNKESGESDISKSEGAIIIGGGPTFSMSDESLAKIANAVASVRNQLVK